MMIPESNLEKTAMAVDVFDRRAKEYAARFMDVEGYDGSYGLFLKALPQGAAQVLDIACGPGNVTQYLLRHRPDLKVTGIDLAPNMLALAQENNPTAEFHVMDCRDIKVLGRNFEGIMCAFALPYLSREEAIALIADMATILNDGGVLCISTMEDDYANSRMQTGSQGDTLFMHFHEAQYLCDALEANGFRILDLKRQAFEASGGVGMVDLLIVARKG